MLVLLTVCNLLTAQCGEMAFRCDDIKNVVVSRVPDGIIVPGDTVLFLTDTTHVKIPAPIGVTVNKINEQCSAVRLTIPEPNVTKRLHLL